MYDARIYRYIYIYTLHYINFIQAVSLLLLLFFFNGDYQFL